jgi:hypothetical protein
MNQTYTKEHPKLLCPCITDWKGKPNRQKSIYQLARPPTIYQFPRKKESADSDETRNSVENRDNLVSELFK